MTIDASDGVHIIDFDRGSFHASLVNFQTERARMDRFLSGEFIDNENIIGSDDLA